MDFIEGLPTSKGKSDIFVVDRLTKYGHFVALGLPLTALTIDEYLNQIYKLHGILESIFFLTGIESF